MPGGWVGSTRDTRTPQWQALRRAVIIRDGGRCRWIDNHGGRCRAPAVQVDHIDRNGGDVMNNLRALCTPHHDEKSSKEGNAARWRFRRRREPEQHPSRRPRPQASTSEAAPF